jgi:hypothetical protein
MIINKSDFIEALAEEEFNAGCLKFNIPDEEYPDNINGEEVIDEESFLCRHIRIPKDCLSCSNSFSESSEDGNGDILHCMIQDERTVKENDVCKEWN